MAVGQAHPADESLAYRVVPINPTRDARWDRFAYASPEASFYHLSAWQQLLQDTYHFRSLALGVEADDGALHGVLPLFLVQSPLTGRRLISLPFSDVCGPLATGPRALDQLVAQALALQGQHQAKYLEIRTTRDDLETIAPPLVGDARYVDYVLDLSDGVDAVWSRRIGGVRTKIRKALKLGVTAELGDTERDLRVFYALHLQTTKKHGMPAQPYRYFRNLWQTLRRECPVFLVIGRHQHRVVASSLFVGFRQTLYYVYNASDPDALDLNPNYVVLWEAVQWACQHGYQDFRFGKTSLDNPGLHRFKSQWGAQVVPLRNYYYPQVSGLTSTAYAERTWKHQAITRVWRALPAPVTDLVGGLLYRHLA
jgi:FemAB-related protein (PEP-CTERM system-associated)